MSQNDKILNHLLLHKGKWVPMPELVTASGSYNIHSRIAELRRKNGININNRTVNGPGGGQKKHSFYRIP